jgi:hypothetical protein
MRGSEFKTPIKKQKSMFGVVPMLHKSKRYHKNPILMPTKDPYTSRSEAGVLSRKHGSFGLNREEAMDSVLSTESSARETHKESGPFPKSEPSIIPMENQS